MVWCGRKFNNYEILVPEVHFHAESIGASPVVIAHKMGSYSSFYTQTERNPPIVVHVQSVTCLSNYYRKI